MYIGGPQIFVLQITGMLPYIDGKDGHISCLINDGIVLIGACRYHKLSDLHSERPIRIRQIRRIILPVYFLP